jgi:23S rRNA pseudouridine1911/1915/1917 synthase
LHDKVAALLAMNILTYTVQIAEDKAGLRLDRALAEAMPEISRSRLKALIEDGRVQDGGGSCCAPSRRVREGETYRIDIPAAPVDTLAPQPLPLDVVFEDDAVIVVNKPPGLVVHPGAGNPDRTLVNALIAHCGRLSCIGGPNRPGVVHRLDKDTSGLIIAAKTDHAHIALARQFAEHSIERAYYALVWGVPSPGQGRIVGNIGRDPHHRTRMTVVPQGGKSAATDYRLLSVVAGGLASLIECRPMTGRTHQIRVHMAMIGHPLIGDAVYSGRQRRCLCSSASVALASFRRHALHAFLIGFDHPETNARHNIETNLSSDIIELIGRSKST